MPVPVRRTNVARKGTVRTARHRPKKSSSSAQSWIIGAVIVFVVLPLIGFGIRLGYKSSDDKKVLAEVHELITNAPDYGEHKSYYDRIVDECHPAAFDQAYRIGGRREANSMNEKQYLRLLFSGMKACAERDGEKDIAETCGRIAAQF